LAEDNHLMGVIMDVPQMMPILL